MHPSVNNVHRLCLWILRTVGVAWIAVGFGCATTSLPTYNTGLIQEQAKAQPEPLWIYPAASAFARLDPSAGLSGVVKPKPLPNFIPDIEPPFVVHMNLLSDGSLVCVSPLEYDYELKTFTIAKYYRETVRKVRIVRFNGENASEMWSRVIPAQGVYKTTEINNTLLFSADRYDNEGHFVETALVGLNLETGDVLWDRVFSRPFRYFSIVRAEDMIVVSIDTDGSGGGKTAVEAVDAATGKKRWSVSADRGAATSSERNIWPIVLSDRIVLFEDGVSVHRLGDGEPLWKRTDIHLAGVAQPIADRDTVWLQDQNGLDALDLRSGKTVWTCTGIKDDLVKLTFSGAHLYTAESEESLFSGTHHLKGIDPDSGKILWRHTTDAILGNIIEIENRVFFSTVGRLVSLNAADGSEVFRKDLPWDDEFSYHVISRSGSAVTVKNEWNVAMWRRKDGEMVYHHPFEPLCPIITTQARMEERRALGAQVSAMTAGSVSFTSFVDTANAQSQFDQPMSNYRSTGNSAYLSEAQANYGIARASIAQQRTLAGMQFGLAMSMATFQIGTQILHLKINITDSMVLPQIDDAIQNLRAADDGAYVVRLVGVQVADQRFSAIEVVEEASGRSERILLSPYQMPPELTTIAISPMTAHELNGYHPAAIYLPHAYSTAVDLKKKCIYHYGPGLDAEGYVPFDGTGFVRGRMIKLPLRLP